MMYQEGFFEIQVAALLPDCMLAAQVEEYIYNEAKWTSPHLTDTRLSLKG
jgi:hypothetical protein